MRARNKYYAHAKFVFEFLETKKKSKKVCDRKDWIA